MKRLGLSLAFFVALAGAAFAQGGMGPGPGTVHSTGGGAPSYTFTDSPAAIAPGATTATFTSVNIGTASSTRIVIVSLNVEGGTTASMTVGGVSVTKATSEGSGVSDASIWYGNITTGATATIVATSTGANFTRAMICVGFAEGITATPTQTQTVVPGVSPRALPSITVPSTGFALANGVTQSGGTAHSWTNATQNCSIDSTTKQRQAITLTTGAPTLTWTGGGNGHVVGAAWGP